MTTWSPVTGLPIQYSEDASGTAASGNYLKFYASGTTTPINMATDSTGGTTLAKCQLNSLGQAINGSSAVFIPHVNQKYKAVLYPDSTTADANTFASAIWNVDGIERAALSSTTTRTFSTMSDAIAATDLSSGDVLLIKDRANSLWDVVLSSGVTENGYNIVQGVGVATLSYVLRTSDGVNVKAAGALGNGVADDTLPLQAAISLGVPVVWPAGSYLAAGLTQSTNFQRMYAEGHVNIIKNGNGALLTSTGNYVEIEGIQFVGTGYTGDNVVSSGSNPRFINCASYGASGRALKATGDHVQIIGTCGIYATTDSSGTGYDIEIGVSGTATLYHQILSVYTSQATGGILLIDTGSHVISGGQIGKLTIQAGTSPAGVNGGITSGARILGNVTVGVSSAILSSCQFGAVTVTLQAGTSGCRLDASNVYANGATVVNSGNTNNLIEREVSTGSGMKIKWGSDAAYRTLSLDGTDPTVGWSFDGSTVVPNTRGYRALLSGGTATTLATVSSGDVLTFGGSGITRTVISGPSIDLNSTAGTQAQVVDGAFQPYSDNSKTLGTGSLRWSVVYAATGTINTSDERAKQDIEFLNDAENRVAASLKSLIRKYRFKDAVKDKGDDARIHIGIIAQEVVKAFEEEGLDALKYGIVCLDALDGGDRYGVRYDELHSFILAAL